MWTSSPCSAARSHSPANASAASSHRPLPTEDVDRVERTGPKASATREQFLLAEAEDVLAVERGWDATPPPHPAATTRPGRARRRTGRGRRASSGRSSSLQPLRPRRRRSRVPTSRCRRNRRRLPPRPARRRGRPAAACPSRGPGSSSVPSVPGLQVDVPAGAVAAVPVAGEVVGEELEGSDASSAARTTTCAARAAPADGCRAGDPPAAARARPRRARPGRPARRRGRGGARPGRSGIPSSTLTRCTPGFTLASVASSSRRAVEAVAGAATTTWSERASSSSRSGPR